MKLLLLLLTIIALVLTSCGFHSVDNGNIAIVVDSFSKNVHNNVASSGLNFKPFTSFHEVDATDVRVEMIDLQPKDKKGMKFEDVDMTVTVRLVQDKAVKLYQETKEIDPVSHNDSSVLGYNKLQQLIKSVVIKSFQTFGYQEFMDDRDKLESKIKSMIEDEIEVLMYGAYTVKSVNTTTINLMSDIEKSFQNRSLVAQKERLVAIKERLMLKELGLKEKEMDRLGEIAKKVGISVKDLMDYKIQNDRNEVLSDLSKGSTSVMLQVD